MGRFMIYAWIDGKRRQPLVKGEKTVCRDCGGTLSAVLPAQNIYHWRHKAGDCDTQVNLKAHGISAGRKISMKSAEKFHSRTT